MGSAELPEDRSEDVKAVLREDGRTDNYFAGDGQPDGPGHGHVVVGPDGHTYYERQAKRDLPGSTRAERISKNEAERSRRTSSEREDRTGR